MSTTFKSISAAAALVGALVLFSAATAERRDVGIQGVSCPAFAWPNSYSACLDDGSGRPARWTRWNSLLPTGCRSHRWCSNSV
jgi:hypothetical protein